MKRVAIIGSPGAGKSYLSRELAQITSLPLVHLDKIYHDKSFDYLNNRNEWLKRVTQEVVKPRWIIEGNYKSSFALRLPAADTIIFLDYSKPRVLWRVFKRRVQYRNKLRSEMPEGWKEKIDPVFLKFVWNYKKSERPMVHELLGQFKNKEIVILTTPKETKQFLKTLV